MLFRFFTLVIFSLIFLPIESFAQCGGGSFKVLHFTKTSGYNHGTWDESRDMFQNIGSNKNFTVTQDGNGGEFNSLSNLQQYAVVIFSNTSGNNILNSTQRTNFENYIKSGGSYIGIHAASDTYRHSSANGGRRGTWDWYAENVAGCSVQEGPNHTSSNHNNNMDHQVNSHPTLGSLPDPWNKTEEYYYWQNGYLNNSFTEVLRVRQTGGAGYDAPRMTAHVKELQWGGRAFYTSLGHSSNNFKNDQNFIRLLENAVLWTAAPNINSGGGAGLSVTGSVVNESCQGNDGSIALNISGGSGNYTIQWSNGQRGATATGLGAGTYSVVVSDGAGCSESLSFTLTKDTNCQTPIILNANQNQTNEEGDNISLQVTASGGDGALKYTANNLPAGLSINSSSGLISGSVAMGAAANSPYSVQISVDDSDSNNADVKRSSFRWTINTPPITSTPINLTPISNQTNEEGDNINLQVNASGGDGALKYTANNLPNGLSINSSTGLISGSIATGAAANSPYSVEISVDDADSDNADIKRSSFSWTIKNPPVTSTPINLTPISDQTNEEGDQINLPVRASGGDGALKYTANNLPAGLSINSSSGLISGSISMGAAANSPYSVEVLVDDADSDNADVQRSSFSWIVKNPPASSTPINLTPVSNQTNEESDQINLQVRASGGDGALKYTASNLPNGLSINSTTGLISGSIAMGAAANSPYSVEILVDDADSDNADVKRSRFSWRVNKLPATSIPIELTSVSDQANQEEDNISLQIRARGGDGALKYTVSNLPAGLTANPSTGLISGNIALGAAANSPYTVKVSVDDSDADMADIKRVEFNWNITEKPSNPTTEACFETVQGQVIMEAENYSALIPGSGNLSGSTWESYVDISASGNIALRAEPNVGAWTGLNTNGPRLDYEINFHQAGTYYVYIRTSAPTGNDNSFHVGLNGTCVTCQSGKGMGLTGSWDWAENANGERAVMVEIPNTGKHVFNVWMREDGVQIDKIIIKDSQGLPSGMGAEESRVAACGISGGNQAPLAKFRSNPDPAIVGQLINFDASLSTDPEGAIVSYTWDFGDGSTGTGMTITHTYPQVGVYTVNLIVKDQGGLSNEYSAQVRVSQDNTVENACYEVKNGEVVIEAENFTSSDKGSANAAAHTWISFSDPEASEGKALRAQPNIGVNTQLNTNGPRLDYDIYVEEIGVYKVYIRTQSDSRNDNSYHVGLNGNAVTNLTGIGMGVYGPWDWAETANWNKPVVLKVTEPGKNTVNIWMREDGVAIDKIILTKKDKPTGMGTEESTKAPCGNLANQAPTPLFTVTASTGFAPLELSVDASGSTDAEGPIASYSWDFGDGSTGTGMTSSHSYVAVGIYSLTLTVTDAEGLSSRSSRTITVTPSGNEPLCFQEMGGIVVMEAENYAKAIPGSNNAMRSSWKVFMDPKASMGKALRAGPNLGVWTGNNIDGPRLDYPISFTTAGTYRIFVRTSSPGQDDDSYHVGLNGIPVSNFAGKGMGLNGPWAWAEGANNRDFVEIIIPTTGQYTFNIWMREDGVEIDKIILKIDTEKPEGMGPDESASVDCNSFGLQNDTFSVSEMGGNANIIWGNFQEEFQDKTVLERSVDGVIFEILREEEIDVDLRINTYVDANIHQYGVDKIFYRLRVKDSFDHTRETRNGVLTLDNATNNFDFNAYPNPASEMLSISYHNALAKQLTVTVVNSYGQVLHTYQLEEQNTHGKLDLRVDGWPKGLYFIQLTDGIENISRKIIVK